MEDLRQVFVIKATKDISPDDKIKVAAYCRVSTDSYDQLNSFIEQVRYYTDFINQNPNMKLVDIYADEGVTGTSIAKRDEFNRMMSDAKKGKIDKIYVKSVSRFARNSKECLENIRLLIGVVTADWKVAISIAIIPKVLKRNSFKEQFAVLSLKL